MAFSHNLVGKMIIGNKLEIYNYDTMTATIYKSMPPTIYKVKRIKSKVFKRIF